MNKKSLLLLGSLVFALVLFSGCIKVDLRETVSGTGVSDVSIIMDMSAIPIPDDQADQDPCADMSSSMGGALTDMTCTYDSEGQILTLSGKFDRKGTAALTMEDTKFRLDVRKAIESFDTTGEMTLPESSEELKQAKAMGVEYNYYVKLPGTMTKQEGGEVQDDGYVKFDVLDLPSKAYVESDTATGLFGLDMTTLMIIAAVVIVLLVIIVFVFLRKR